MLESFRELCLLPGVSGNEGPVADYLREKLAGVSGVSCRVDALGNLLVHKTGAHRARTRLLLSAHMDEVGLMVAAVTEEGMLKLAPVGGIDPRVVLGRRVKVGERAVKGVIGTKAVHQQDAGERKTAPDFKALSIDIGTSSKEEAQKLVKPGDTAVFDSEFVEFGDGMVKSKAIDDRVGCAILLDLLRVPLEFDADFAFTVQEEVGTRGARVAAFGLEPDAALVVEATTAADVPFVSAENKVCFLGQGPVISFMDNGTVYDRALCNLAFAAAGELGVPCQMKKAVAGGNDARAIHLARGGVRPLAVSLPCRYLHSPSCVIRRADAESTLRLVAELARRISSAPAC